MNRAESAGNCGAISHSAPRLPLASAAIEVLENRCLLSGAHDYIWKEAENFDSAVMAADLHRWDGFSYAGFNGSGVRAMENDKGKYEFSGAVSSARLDYQADFAQAGKYYVWVRGIGFDGNSDSVHLGLDSTPQISAGNIAVRREGVLWSTFSTENSLAGFLMIPTAGAHTINLFMREAGTSVDQIFLTTDKAFKPANAPPVPAVTIATNTPTSGTAAEGDAGVTYTFTRSSGAGENTLTVTGTVIGGDANADDYTLVGEGVTYNATNGTFSIEFGLSDAQKQITVKANADAAVEGEEYVVLELDEPTGSSPAYHLGGSTQVHTTIIDIVPIINLDLNADGDTDDAVDGADNFRPGYLIDGTQLIDDSTDQHFNVVVTGLLPYSVVTFELANVTAYSGRSSNSGSDSGFDIELGGSSVSMDSTGTAIMNATNKDFGGNAKIVIKVGEVVVATMDFSKDDDGDGLPNWWENQYGENLNANSDDDKNVGGANGAAVGDKLPALDEFRGFMVTEGGQVKHIRTDPTIKDVFVSDALNYTIADGGGDALSLTAKAHVNVHRVIAGQFNAGRKINFNGDNGQRVVVIEDGPTGGAAGRTRGPDNDKKPSNYEFVHIWVDFFKSSVELAKDINAGAQPYVFYDGTTDQNRTADWQAGGRVKIADEIIGYDTGIGPGNTAADVATAQIGIPATGRNIVVNGTAAFNQFKVGDEVVTVVDHNAGLAGGTVAATAAGDTSVTVSGSWSAYPEPPANEVYLVRIGTGATLEWVSYAGRTITNGTVTLTGVARGLLGTQDRNHAAGTPYERPSQFIVNRGAFGTTAAAIAVNTAVKPVGVWTNVTRGVAGTAAVAHAAGAAIRVFATDDGMRETVAHEFGHAIGMVPHRDNSIMQIDAARGAFLGNGSFDNFLAASQDEIDAR